VFAGLATLVLGVAVWWVPYLSRDRDYAASVVQPLPLKGPTQLVLGAGQRACLAPATMTTDSTQARFMVGTYFRPGPPMELSITGPGYATRRSIRAGFPDNATLRVNVPPPRRDMSVRLCIANRGDRRVALNASADRTKTAARTQVDGRPGAANPTFAFYAARPAAITSRLSRIVERVSLFKPGIVGSWLLWPLLVATAAGIPVGALWALRRAVDDDEARPGPWAGDDDRPGAGPAHGPSLSEPAA
jgi:hypothetical protein